MGFVNVFGFVSVQYRHHKHEDIIARKIFKLSDPDPLVVSHYQYYDMFVC